MDRMTTSICEKPYGRASFARVLVEIDSNKPLVDSVELWYESLGKVLKLWVEHTWVPPRCEECKVFGNYLSDCTRKVNTVSAINKNGENVKVADVKQGNKNEGTNNGDGDVGWQTAGNRRNGRGVGNNVRQGSVGGYNVRRGINNNRCGSNNKGNSSVGNTGTRDANKKVENDVNKKAEPVNNGNVGKVDESMVANDDGELANKGKSKVYEGVVGTDGQSKSGNNNPKQNMANKNSRNKNRKVSNNGNKNVQGCKKADVVNSKDSSGVKRVATSNRFDLLMEEGVNEITDLWNEVKKQVATACNSGIPIAENVLKGWSADMVRFYTVKWNNRIMNNGSPQQHLEFKIKNLSNQIVQLNRNLNNNAILMADKMLKTSVLTTQDQRDILFNKFYDEAFRAELAKIEVLEKEKNLTEVDMFLLSNKPLDNDCKQSWNDDMINYYVSRCDEINSDRINGHSNDMGGIGSGDEVEEETSDADQFMVQNEITNAIDN
ncbi:hypothetical protein CTI12_AA581910 [Artemisia annua]|uniref:Zinc knuckle CX2CX4HX4C n=1 Tax=Artemisia annua TaxID=35608 RepID=A0A2U1KNT5_ARTAN|nr:hypothetical protein CTI12_AA581910 [Artemisia annua]